MRINVSTFTALLVVGLALLAFALWCASMLVFAEQHKREHARAFAGQWQAQVSQLQQKQRLWLESQFYRLSAVAGSGWQGQGAQSYLWNFYQQNPKIHAVNLVDLDDLGRLVSRVNKPACLRPGELKSGPGGSAEATTIASCRVDDRVLLEIAGPLPAPDDRMLLLVSMDYFDFIDELSTLSQRRLARAAITADSILYREISAGDDAELVAITLADGDAVYGQLQLSLARTSFANLFWWHGVFVLLALIAAAAAVLASLRYKLIGPLERLAADMREAARNRDDAADEGIAPLPLGLDILRDHLGRLQTLAKRDPVTGLNNRVIFEDRLLQAIREGKRSARRYALVLIDLRGLDEIAQQRGQYLADALLRQVAENLRRSLRESDHLARFERNLFSLLLEVQQPALLDTLVDKIYLSVVRRYRVYGREFDLEAFFGIALYPDHALDADALYQNASDALVRAETSEWPIVFYREADEATDTSGFTLIQSLRRAIDRDELKLVFQPVVDFETYETIYFEALLRWRDPRRHGAPIERIIRLAEQNHLIKPLTNWTIDAACRFISECGVDDIVIGINLSMIDLHDRQLPQRIESCLQQYAIRPGQIVIEITEGQIMQDPDEVVEVLAHLGVMGLSLSIDDFGTGQASLTYLKELPVEKLKIDQSFVRDMLSNPDDRLIVKATIELAHTLDLKVVAEGVETLAVYELLAEMTCDYMQGYYISHPLEAGQVRDWLKTSIKPDLFRKDR